MAPRVARVTLRDRSIHTVRARFSVASTVPALSRRSTPTLARRSRPSTMPASPPRSRWRRAPPTLRCAGRSRSSRSLVTCGPSPPSSVAAARRNPSGQVPDPCSLGFPSRPKVHITRHGEIAQPHTVVVTREQYRRVLPERQGLAGGDRQRAHSRFVRAVDGSPQRRVDDVRRQRVARARWRLGGSQDAQENRRRARERRAHAGQLI